MVFTFALRFYARRHRDAKGRWKKKVGRVFDLGRWGWGEMEIGGRETEGRGVCNTVMLGCLT